MSENNFIIAKYKNITFKLDKEKSLLTLDNPEKDFTSKIYLLNLFKFNNIEMFGRNITNLEIIDNLILITGKYKENSITLYTNLDIDPELNNFKFYKNRNDNIIYQSNIDLKQEKYQAAYNSLFEGCVTDKDRFMTSLLLISKALSSTGYNETEIDVILNTIELQLFK